METESNNSGNSVEPDLGEVSEPPGRYLTFNHQAAPIHHGVHTPLSVHPAAAATLLSETPRNEFLPPRRNLLDYQQHAFRHRFFPGTSIHEWNRWQWQLQHRIQDYAFLSRILNLSDAEKRAFALKPLHIKMGITPYYASLLDPDNPDQPLRKTMIPIDREFESHASETEDPLGEENQSPVPGLVHRYPDRVLFLVTNHCAANCRYCTRSRILDSETHVSFRRTYWQEAIDYIQRTRTVRDVLVSGGDPLTLSDDNLDWLLQQLRQIPHVEIIRIGTKVPVAMPQRINSRLVKMLRKYHPLLMSIHFTHPDELTPVCQKACERLADAGIPLGSQTVLLAGVNDSVETIKQLMHGLLKCRVRPYYLYQCDPIINALHFRTRVEKGLEIIRGLRGHTSGYAVPTFVIDAPGGGGKIPLLPDYVVGYEGTDLILKNYLDQQCRYPDVGCGDASAYASSMTGGGYGQPDASEAEENSP